MTADEINLKLSYTRLLCSWGSLQPPEHDHHRILALGLLISIAIIFWHMDNKPLSAWAGRLSLNATISSLTTAYTTALMHGVSTFISQFKWLHFKKGRQQLSHLEIFDRASRGVWRSILLVTTMPFNIATIGAYITVLRLGFSSFTQQVEESIPQESGMQLAVDQGLFGFRAECKHVSQATLETESCGREHPDDPVDAVNVCTLKTPTGLNLGYHQVLTSGATTYTMNVITLVPNLTLQDTFPELTRFAILRSSRDGYYNMYDTNVTECWLFFTAYEYAGATANGDEFSFASRREIDLGVRNPWGFMSGDKRLAGKVYTNEIVHKGVRIPALWADYHSLKALQNFLPPSLREEYVWPNSGAVTALMGNVDIPERFDSIATTMTGYIRMAYVLIQWWYFVVPVVTEVFAIFFAILSVVSNRRSRQHEQRSGLLQTSGKDFLKLEAESEMAQARLN
ncbi:hypothetical protein BDV09DRAFT_188405 [Aspergillus tetrazonus]